MSNDIGKILLAKTNTIAESWIESIRQNIDIKSSKGLAHTSVRNSIPLVIEALASLLSDSITDKPQQLKDGGLEHGFVRAEQGYDVAEIMREYSLLRTIIFATLKSDLLAGSKDEMFQAIELIDSVVDQVISLSLDSYVDGRLEEFKQLRGQLVLTNQELTRLVETQKEDLAHLAHELKSPLNSIMGFSSLLMQQQQRSTQGENALDLQMTRKVIKNSKQLLRLINDVLEMSRYEAGKIPLNVEALDLRSLILGVTEAFEPSANQKNLEIIFDDNDAPQLVQSDLLRLQQVVTNLVSNAIHYTESGTIRITCKSNDHNRWSIAVEDTGIGISPEVQTHIFEPYYRASSLGNGTGLGLAIVEKLVKLLQGKVDLVSQLEKGSTFTVTFPMTVVLS
ncbi:sensor histidine kinase [Pleurocapsa sp. FMAR1]|uniref:sensor histidine kinase n=1 Tax=Pleurocapsa sp. FMAR1 TaxID=3040204 RepID=UPI0029C8E26D|nr:sensor histidine kinase [Pleurocapsa sp. FMAR1]